MLARLWTGRSSLKSLYFKEQNVGAVRWPILRVDGVNAVELTKKIRSHAAAAPPAALPAAPKVGSMSCKVLQILYAPIISFFPGGLGHEVEAIDKCSQVHAVYEGEINLSHLPQYQ